MIDPNIWESEDFGSLTSDEKVLFIGMISNADDEGRGKASPGFLAANIFRYDHLSTDEVSNWLRRIGEVMSVTFYEVDEKMYYQFDHWDEWQKISHPSPSKIPSPEDSRGFQNIPEDSVNTPERYATNESNLIENKLNINESNLMEEIKEYGIIHGIPERVCLEFFTYNSEHNWIIKGEPMQNWKTALEAWNRKARTLSNHNYEEHSPTELKVHFANLEDDEDAEI